MKFRQNFSKKKFFAMRLEARVLRASVRSTLPTKRQPPIFRFPFPFNVPSLRAGQYAFGVTKNFLSE
jgi:hypothetical protein